MPNQGPTVTEIEESAETGEFELVDVTTDVARGLSTSVQNGFSSRFLDAPRLAADPTLGVGDQLTIRIFEAGAGGLFAGQNGNGSLALPNVLIDRTGQITLPYVGAIQARGQTEEDIEREIVEALQGTAIEPQAEVVRAVHANNSVTVFGEVARPARMPLSTRGDRLAEALVASGGSRHPAHDTLVSITRGGYTSDASLQLILDHPAQNIALRPGDLITVTHKPKSYTVIGSVARPADVPFTEPRISALEALGKSSGLDDSRANPEAIFLLRREAPQTLRNIGQTPANWWASHASGVPTVYRLDLSDPAGLFIAQSVYIRDGDVLYAANADSVQLRKVLGIVGLTATTTNQVANAFE